MLQALSVRGARTSLCPEELSAKHGPGARALGSLGVPPMPGGMAWVAPGDEVMVCTTGQ